MDPIVDNYYTVLYKWQGGRKKGRREIRGGRVEIMRGVVVSLYLVYSKAVVAGMIDQEEV